MLNAVVSIQGQPGSFHHLVARSLFGPDTPCLYRDTFREVFEDVACDRAGTAILAIENSIAGSLIYNYDLLASYRIPVKGEFTLRIAQQLIAHPGVTLDQVVEVWSHPMAIEQCRAFLDPLRLTILEKPDTAGSVRELKESGRRDVAAISSAASADLYGMTVLRADIETDPHNYTRFLVLTHQDLPPALNRADKKTSLHFSVVDAPGSLARVLGVLDLFKVNMCKIESRPKVGSTWKYDFFCDISTDIHSIDGLFDALTGATEHLNVLGVYGDLSS
jgi:prephenate dehydratase